MIFPFGLGQFPLPFRSMFDGDRGFRAFTNFICSRHSTEDGYSDESSGAGNSPLSSLRRRHDESLSLAGNSEVLLVRQRFLNRDRRTKEQSLSPEPAQRT